MANAQNIDKIFAELAKKVQREVQINLPRKVGIIAKNHFTDNFLQGRFRRYKPRTLADTKRQNRVGEQEEGLDMYCWPGMMLTRCCGIFEGMEGDVKKKILYSNK